MHHLPNIFPSFCGLHMLPKITWVTELCCKHSLWSVSSIFSEKFYRQVPEDAKIFSPKALYSLKQPRRSAIKQHSASALYDVLPIYEILEWDQSSRSYLLGKTDSNHSLLHNFAKQKTCSFKERVIFYCKGLFFVRQPYLKKKVVDLGIQESKNRTSLARICHTWDEKKLLG